MTHLNIQQGSNVEIVTTLIILKLYEAALSVPEPLSGEEDAAYMSGNLLVAKTYRSLVEYLTNRFDDLSINITVGYYVPFEDSAVLNVLLANNIGSDGIGVTEAEAANANLVGVFNRNTDITKFNEFRYFTSAKTNIPGLLFYLCSNLKEVYLEDTISIGSAAFRECGIEDVNAPSLLSIDVNCFNQSGVKTITNLGSITTIPDYAFYRCKSLLSAVLPSTVTSIGAGAFNCTYTQVVLNFTTISGLDNVTSFGNSCFSSRSSLVIQGSSILNALTIGSNAFKDSGLTGTLNLPNLISLGLEAFRDTRITSITDLGTITEIPVSCFYSCASLATISLPQSVITIREQAFRNCSSLTTFDFSNIISIESSAFLNSGLTGDLNLPNLTGTLGSNSFTNTGISSISSLGSVTEIGEYVFENTNISSITIPNSVRKCGCNIVHNTIVPEIIFPEGVELITGGLFHTKNNSLTYIEIPSTVTNMGIFFHRSLENSQNNLCTVIIKAITPPALGYYSDNTYSTKGDKFAGIYVPDSSLTAYQNGANAWLHSSIQAKLKPISQLLTDNPTAWAKYNRTSTV